MKSGNTTSIKTNVERLQQLGFLPHTLSPNTTILRDIMDISTDCLEAIVRAMPKELFRPPTHPGRLPDYIPIATTIRLFAEKLLHVSGINFHPPANLQAPGCTHIDRQGGHISIYSNVITPDDLKLKEFQRSKLQTPIYTAFELPPNEEPIMTCHIPLITETEQNKQPTAHYNYMTLPPAPNRHCAIEQMADAQATLLYLDTSIANLIDRLNQQHKIYYPDHDVTQATIVGPLDTKTVSIYAMQDRYLELI